MVSPTVHKFDETPLAGGIHQLGTGIDSELIGANTRLDFRTIVGMIKRDQTDDDDDCDGDIEMDDDDFKQYDPDKVMEYANRISTTLYRACDAHHIQSLTAPLTILVANFFKTSLSSKTGLCDGQTVEARWRSGTVSRTWHAARVECVNDDGSVYASLLAMLRVCVRWCCASPHFPHTTLRTGVLI